MYIPGYRSRIEKSVSARLPNSFNQLTLNVVDINSLIGS